jgi:hypothetical protein
MASKEEIKKALLASVGNPESGPIAQNADKMAEAVCCIDEKAETKEEPKVEEKAEPKASKPVKETRVQEASEIR